MDVYAETIDLYRENLEKHGQDSETAKWDAVRTMHEGIEDGPESVIGELRAKLAELEEQLRISEGLRRRSFEAGLDGLRVAAEQECECGGTGACAACRVLSRVITAVREVDKLLSGLDGGEE